MSDKVYGFYNEVYDNGSELHTLMTGDGKTLFTDMDFGNGVAAIAIGYGKGQGLNTQIDHGGAPFDDSIGAKWQVKFEHVDSVDAMIRCLERVKKRMTDTAPKG